MKNIRDKNGNILVDGAYEDADIKVNPTMSGSEPELTGVEIKGQKYRVVGGGGGGFNITTIQEGQKIKIDLSKVENYFPEFVEGEDPESQIFTRYVVNTGPIILGSYSGAGLYEEDTVDYNPEEDSYYPPYYYISLAINNAHTQILCSVGQEAGSRPYDSLMPTTVVYTSETAITYDDQTNEIDPEVLAQLPTIELEVPEKLVGKVVKTTGNVPFEIVD